MTTSSANTIAGIIEKRQPRARRIQETRAVLGALSASLRVLDEQRDLLQKKITDAEVIGRLRDVNLASVQRKIADELDALEKLSARFARDTINIGVVGRAGQGKSRLLQSISGLPDAVIPSGERGMCTGVRSTVLHNPDIEPYAEVSFHTDKTFLDEVIAPYYRELRLGVPPSSIDELAASPLPPLPEELAGQAAYAARYEHLERYKQNLPKYSGLLRAESPRRITPDQIREYVAQDTIDGERVYFNYLAVREVRIVTAFPHADVGAVALVDMPGLGDTGIGNEARMLSALGQDVDIVLFVKMPASLRAYWADVDVSLYDSAQRAITELPLDQWAFMVLNRTTADSKNGDNSENCRLLAKSIGENHIHTADCLISDCSDTRDVERSVLSPVLSYLTDAITALDARYASYCQDRIVRIQADVNAELERARHALGRAPSFSGEFPLFERLFDNVWDDLTTGLEGLLREVRSLQDAPNSLIKEHVEATIQTCEADPGIPPIDQIEIRRNRVGSYQTACNEYLHEIRTHLTRQFLPLDDSLRNSLENVKQWVADVLIQRGRLGALTYAQGSSFLRVLADTVPDELEGLKLGFQILATFELSYRGFIQHRMRRHLDRLTPDTTPLKLSNTPSAQEVQFVLRTMFEETLYSLGTAFDDWISEPNQVAFAIVEEFVDRVLRAEDVHAEWRFFYYSVRSQIWPSEFQELGEHSQLRRQWETAVERASAANLPGGFQFLN